MASHRDDLRRRAESRRAAALAADARDRRAEKSKLRSILHYSGLPITSQVDRRRRRWRNSATAQPGRAAASRSLIANHLHRITVTTCPSSTSPRSVTPTCRRTSSASPAATTKAAMSTLCAGCGHDSITAVDHRGDLGARASRPEQLVKLSGIGCSSKTTAYFASGAHGFNGVHGRMPSVATGANAANKPALHRRVRRRRFAVDRLRPVRACDPPQREHAVHLREQRRVRPDQGPVLRIGRHRQQVEEGRGEPPGAGRPGASRRCRSAARSSRAASPATTRSSCR